MITSSSRTRRLAILTALGYASFIGPSQAQRAPDAGALQQQIERERQPVMPPALLTPKKSVEPTPMRPQKGVTLNVKSLRFEGNKRLSSEQLAPLLASYLDRPLDFVQLNEAAAVIAKTYADAGWLVRAYVPTQDISGDEVSIQIVEAVFGGIVIEGKGSSRVRTAVVRDVLEAEQKVGQPLNLKKLDRALLLADDLPGVSVAGTLSEGRSGGETDMLLTLTDESLLTGDVLIDNTGSRSTGAPRLSLNVNLNSPFGAAEQLGMSVIHTQGSDYLRLGSTIPLGSKGVRFGLNASHLQYRLIGSEFAALKSTGTSDTFGAELTYPMIRSRTTNLYTNLNLDVKQFDNRSGGEVVTRYKAIPLSFGLTFNRFDDIGQGGATTANLAISAGKIDLAGSPNAVADAATTQTAGRYSKLRIGATRLQMFSKSVSAYAAFTSQWTDKNLDSSEKIYLGGANGVRAYPVSEAGGSLGSLLNLELRWRLPYGFNVTGLFDIGSIKTNVHNNFMGAQALNAYSLKGAGLAASWQMTDGPLFKAVWSRRIGENPNPSTTGKDQDGALVTNRVWLTANMSR